MKVVVVDYKGRFECHKAECKDANKKINRYGHSAVQEGYWFEDSLDEAEKNFNEDLGVDAGYEPPWVWNQHVEVYPCAKKG